MTLLVIFNYQKAVNKTILPETIVKDFINLNNQDKLKKITEKKFIRYKKLLKTVIQTQLDLFYFNYLKNLLLIELKMNLKLLM